MPQVDQSAGDLTLAPGLTRDCVDPWEYVEFRVNGDVAPCCARPGVGNLASQNLAAILNGDAIRALRAALLQGTLDRACTNCTLRAPTTPAVLTEKVEQLLSKVAVPPLFEPASYLAANPDVAAPNVDPLHHFLAYGRFEGRRLLPGPHTLPVTFDFDPELYLLMNPDVARAGRDPREHFLHEGRYEGRKLRPRVISD
jgi:hypothetical protein